jgi:medium-chain acyl-[acyl-carrier-protein] hydrolase
MVSRSESAKEPPDSSSRRWFEYLSIGQRQSLRLFCFPYAGGSAQVFRKWRRHFPSEIGMCLVHLPGRGMRIGEQPFIRLKPLVETIADLIVREPQPPYALFGHSMGSLISFELARELRRRGFTAPVRLFLSGRGAPISPDPEPPTFNLPHDAFIAEVRRLNGTPGELLDNAETRELFLPLLRADFEMVDTYEYHPEEPLSCPFTLYGGLEDQDVPVEKLRAWEELTSGGCTMRMFAGDHFFIHSSAVFLDALRDDILSTVQNLVQKI